MDSTDRCNTSTLEVLDGQASGMGHTADGASGDAVAGTAPIRRDVERASWVKIAEGMTSEAAAVTCGVSPVVGSRWFRERGGMPSIRLGPPSVFRGTRRNRAAQRPGRGSARDRTPPGQGSVDDLAGVATQRGHPRRAARLPGLDLAVEGGTDSAASEDAEAHGDERLREYVQDRLAGDVRRPDGTQVTGPKTPRWKGRNKPHRQDRQWATAWSPSRSRADQGRLPRR